jgi:hypothetical protein
MAVSRENIKISFFFQQVQDLGTVLLSRNAKAPAGHRR